MPPCYLFAGGGTGGHLTPGLAVAEELRRHDPHCRIVFVGTERHVESRLHTAHPFERFVLPTVSTAVLWRNPLRFVWNNTRAYFLARRWLREWQPQGVIGLGGFASVPLIKAAHHRNVPTLLLEQNVLPGRATRWLARSSTAVCLSFAETLPHLPRHARCIVTGNPVRPDIARLHPGATTRVTSSRTSSVDHSLGDTVSDTVGDSVESSVESAVATSGKAASSPAPLLLVLGGSLGARAINEALVTMLSQPEWREIPLRIVHQTGVDHFEATCAGYRTLPHWRVQTAASLPAEPQTVVVQPFLTDMHRWYAAATCAVARAGATTLAELACAGCPAVCIPYPQAADNHQWHNADLFARAGASLPVIQSADSPTTARDLSRALTRLITDITTQQHMSQAMRQMARPDAAQNVVAVLQSLTDRL